MEGQLKTSFIPKRSLVQKVPGSPYPKKGHLFVRFSVILFIVVIILAIVVGIYSISLKSNNAQLKTTLDKTVQSLQPVLLSNVNKTYNRIEATKLILAQHIALSSFFGLLGNATLKSVRYTSFSYTGGNNQKITVTMTGQAQNFSAIALQADQFSSPDYQSYFHNPIFSNLGLDKSGNVTFSLSLTLDSSAFLYAHVLATPIGVPVDQAAAAIQAPQATDTVQTTNTTQVVQPQ